MAFAIQRTDGSVDGLGDRVSFATEADAWDAARVFAVAHRAPARDGIESWLRVVEVPDWYGWTARELRASKVDGLVSDFCGAVYAAYRRRGGLAAEGAVYAWVAEGLGSVPASDRTPLDAARWATDLTTGQFAGDE